jgi:uncharacterized membrane protein
VSETALTREEASRVQGALAALRVRLRSEADKVPVAARVVYAGAASYAALFAFAAVIHYLVFKTPRGDLGTMVQAIWNTLHGHFLEGTTQSGHEAIRFRGHVDPFLVIFVPLLWVWSSPLLLPVLQAVAVASGALPVFWLARKHLGTQRAGAHFAFAYLLYPATQFSTFTVADSFHSVAIVVPLVLYALWFLDEDRLVAFSAVALLAFTTREEIPLAVGCIGIWYAFKKGGRRLFGIGFFTGGLAVTLFNFLWLIPHFSSTGADPYTGRYRAVGGTPHGMVHKLVTDPLAFVHAVATGHKALYLCLLLMPFLCLSLFEPLLLLGAVPDLAINLLSSSGGQTSIGYQYTAGIVPFVVVAAVFGASRFRGYAAGLSLAALVATAAVAMLTVAVLSPILILTSDVGALGSPLVRAKAHAVSLIPNGAPVSASNQLGGHLSERSYIVTFPQVRRVQWIVVDTNDPDRLNGRWFKRKLRRYESDKAWRVVFSSRGIVVLRRLPNRTSVEGS